MTRLSAGNRPASTTAARPAAQLVPKDSRSAAWPALSTAMVRGLLTGTPIGSSGAIALSWCVGLLGGSVAFASWAFRRRSRS
jgi:hypothetical protein